MADSKKYSLDEMILKAIPVNEKCAIEEQYNKHRRKLLKERFNTYLADQLSQQFNARPYKFSDKNGVDSGSN